MKIFRKSVSVFNDLTLTRKVIVSLVIASVSFILFYMIAYSVNNGDGAFEISNTGIVWIFYLLTIGFYFFYYEIRSEKSDVKYLRAISYEKDSRIVVLANSEGQLYRFNRNFFELLLQNGFLKKDGDKTFKVTRIDNIVLFTSILNRIDTLDRKLHEETDLNYKLGKISNDTQWIKEKLGYDTTTAAIV